MLHFDSDYMQGACSFYADANHEHMVETGVLYVSQPSEYGTLYSLAELEELCLACDRFEMRLYIDGARMAYAFGCSENDVSLSDLARLADAFYLGGTKCGALMGEAVVFSNAALADHFLLRLSGMLVFFPRDGFWACSLMSS